VRVRVRPTRPSAITLSVISTVKRTQKTYSAYMSTASTFGLRWLQPSGHVGSVIARNTQFVTMSRRTMRSNHFHSMAWIAKRRTGCDTGKRKRLCEP